MRGAISALAMRAVLMVARDPATDGLPHFIPPAVPSILVPLQPCSNRTDSERSRIASSVVKC